MGKTIYIDMDDVLVESMQTYLRVMEEYFGRTVAFESVQQFDLRVSFGLSDEEYEQFFERVHQEQVLLNLEPMAGARDVIAAWKQQGWRIEVVTGRISAAYDASEQWLRTQAMPFDSLTIVDKYSRPEKTEKTRSLSYLKGRTYDFAVEDSPFMAEWLRRELGCTVLLMDRPWNRSLAKDPGLIRCHGWNDVARVAAE